MRFPATAWLARFDSVVGAGRHALAGDRAELPRLDDGAGAARLRRSELTLNAVETDDAGEQTREDLSRVLRAPVLLSRGRRTAKAVAVAVLEAPASAGRRRQADADHDSGTSHGSRCDSCVHLLPHGFLLFVGGSGSCSACYSHLCK